MPHGDAEFVFPYVKNMSFDNNSNFTGDKEEPDYSRIRPRALLTMMMMM